MTRSNFKTIPQMLKMALPHVGIALLLFFYLVMGAAVFQYVEYDADVEIQKSKLARIKQVGKRSKSFMV